MLTANFFSLSFFTRATDLAKKVGLIIVYNSSSIHELHHNCTCLHYITISTVMTNSVQYAMHVILIKEKITYQAKTIIRERVSIVRREVK